MRVEESEGERIRCTPAETSESARSAQMNPSLIFNSTKQGQTSKGRAEAPEAVREMVSMLGPFGGALGLAHILAELTLRRASA